MANEKRLIDANLLMEHLTRCIDAEKGLFRAVCVAIKCFVEQMPTVDAVEVVHGRWEFEKNPYMRDVWLYRCTACDGRCCDNPRYCPNCGAKMDGEEKENNLLFADMEEIIDA